MRLRGILALAVSMAAPAAVAAQRSPAANGVCRSLSVAEPGTSVSRATRRTRSEFSATEILDLELRVLVLPGGVAGRRIELKLFTPKGHLYQALTASTPRGVAGARTGDRRRSRLQPVTARLPVAGTTIVTSSLYGTWRVEAYVEGQSSPCTTPRSFAINP